MQLFQSDPQPLPPHQSDKLAKFFNSEECILIRQMVRSKIAMNIAAFADNTAESAEAFLSARALTEASENLLRENARLRLFLTALGEIEADVRNNKAAILKSLPLTHETTTYA
jgi:hypothetical protein